MRLFDVMMKGIITYGAEQWGWKEMKEIERIQMKYIKWTLRLNRNTTWHTIMKDTERKKIMQETVKRAMRFDAKMYKAEEKSCESTCWGQIRKREEEEWIKRERKVSEKG